MKNVLTLLSLGLFVLLAVVSMALSVHGGEAPENAGAVALAEGNRKFAVDLYGKLSTGEGNLFFSPHSISTCLAMTFAGARGETERQMARVLNFPAGQEATRTAFGELRRQLNALQQSKGVELNVANGLWAQKGHPFLPEFLDVASRDYDAKLQQVDFTKAAEPARVEINNWVSGKTKEKIKNLIGPGLLDGLTRLVLVNAIYFKGSWATPFEKKATADAPFHAGNGQDFTVKMMALKNKDFKYAESADWQLLEMPYIGNGLSMVVLLPRERDGLRKLEGKLTAAGFTAWLAEARSRKVNVFLPRFKLETGLRLDATLSAMGMGDAFGGTADFSGMDGSRDLFLSAVIHKAFVDVNEEGTEAAAATGGVVRFNAVLEPKPIVTFRADHPFIFLIRETGSGSIFFMGRFAEPPKS